MLLIFPLTTALVLVLLSFAVLFKKYRHISNVTFSLSLISTAVVMIGDAMCLYLPKSVDFWKMVGFWGEAVMVPSWLLFALSFARHDFWKEIGRFSKLLVILSPSLVVFLLATPFDDLFYSPDFVFEKVFFLENAGVTFNLLLMLYVIAAVVNLEATFRSSSDAERWQIKYTLIGVFAILAMNIFYYSHALLYRSINMNMFPVKTGIVLMSALLIGFSLMRREVMNVQLSVSRKVFYRSLSIFIVGFYLLGVGMLGQGMRYIGPQIGQNITTFLGFVGAIVILAIILSEQLRRKAAVLISKHFYRSKYDYREQWLKFTQRISFKHSFEDLLSSIAEGFREAIGSRGAAIWLRERDNGKYTRHWASDPRPLDSEPGDELLDFMRSKKWIVDVQDGKCKEVVEKNKFIMETMTSLIVPLLDKEDLVGFIVLRESIADNNYNYEDFDLLKTLAGQATTAILNARLSEELTEAKEMEAVGRLSSFVIHDLKNAASMLSLITQNAKEHMDNPEFQRDAIKGMSNTSEKIKAIIGKLRNIPAKGSLNISSHDLSLFVNEAINDMNLNGNSYLSFSKMEPVSALFDREEISKVITNLVLNAFDATSMQGKVDITVGRENDSAFVKVSDNGCGMSEEFVERKLFRPFYTTKKKGLGIGLYQCKTIVDAHAGRLKVVSEEGRGTDFIMYLPLSS